MTWCHAPGYSIRSGLDMYYYLAQIITKAKDGLNPLDLLKTLLITNQTKPMDIHIVKQEIILG